MPIEYWVDQDVGSDAFSGQSLALPFLTVAKVNAVVATSDILNFKYGGDWSEELDLAVDGVTTRAYGDSALQRPTFNGSAK